jgi:hypothetical protein
VNLAVQLCATGTVLSQLRVLAIVTGALPFFVVAFLSWPKLD